MTVPEVSCRAGAIQNSSEWPCSMCPLSSGLWEWGHPIYIFLIFPEHQEFWTPLQILIWGPLLAAPRYTETPKGWTPLENSVKYESSGISYLWEGCFLCPQCLAKCHESSGRLLYPEPLGHVGNPLGTPVWVAKGVHVLHEQQRHCHMWLSSLKGCYFLSL